MGALCSHLCWRTLLRWFPDLSNSYAQIDNRNKSIGSNKSSAPSSEQAALKRAKEKDAVRQATKDARNEHFQSVVDQDIEIRDSIATTMQARVQSSERLSRAFEMIAIATLTASLPFGAA